MGGLFPDPDEKSYVDLMVSWNNTVPLKEWAIAWDWACNVIVVFPEGGTMKTLMVSEYDNAVRPQSDYTLHNQTISSIGAMEYNNKPVGYPYQRNCGKDCLIFSVENHRHLVGRNFHTAKVEVNIDLSWFDILTLTYDPKYNSPNTSRSFVGLGICRNSSKKSVSSNETNECNGHKGSVALVAYDGE